MYWYMCVQDLFDFIDMNFTCSRIRCKYFIDYDLCFNITIMCACGDVSTILSVNCIKNT